jgi:hypothetical protein
VVVSPEYFRAMLDSEIKKAITAYIQRFVPEFEPTNWATLSWEEGDSDARCMVRCRKPGMVWTFMVSYYVENGTVKIECVHQLMPVF